MSRCLGCELTVHHAVRLVTGRFGQDPFRPHFLAETSLISWMFRPQNVDVSAKLIISLPRCLCKIDACPTPLCLLLLIFVLGFLCFCFRLSFLAFLSDVPKYLLVVIDNHFTPDAQSLVAKCLILRGHVTALTTLT